MNLGHQPWQQASLSTEPSYQPSTNLFYSLLPPSVSAPQGLLPLSPLYPLSPSLRISGSLCSDPSLVAAAVGREWATSHGLSLGFQASSSTSAEPAMSTQLAIESTQGRPLPGLRVVAALGYSAHEGCVPGTDWKTQKHCLHSQLLTVHQLPVGRPLPE